MNKLLGYLNLNTLRKLPAFKSYDSKLLRSLIIKLESDPTLPTDYSAIAQNNTSNWRVPIMDVIDLLGDKMKRLIKIPICKMPNNWYFVQ